MAVRISLVDLSLALVYRVGPTLIGASPKGERGNKMFTDDELATNAKVIEMKKREVLNSKEGSDLDYIRNLQTLIILENAVEVQRGTK